MLFDFSNCSTVRQSRNHQATLATQQKVATAFPRQNMKEAMPSSEPSSFSPEVKQHYLCIQTCVLSILCYRTIPGDSYAQEILDGTELERTTMGFAFG